MKLIKLASGAGFRIDDDRGRSLAYVYGGESLHQLSIAEAEQIARQIARALSMPD